MKLVVGTNFDDKLIEEASRYPVKYLYGSHRATLTGHGRVSFVVPDVTMKGSGSTSRWPTPRASSSSTP